MWGHRGGLGADLALDLRVVGLVHVGAGPVVPAEIDHMLSLHLVEVVLDHWLVIAKSLMLSSRLDGVIGGGAHGDS